MAIAQLLHRDRATLSSPYRGRFAPSPTGDLHLGSAATALIAWLRCRQAGGTLILRVEDIDTPRVLPGCEAEQLADLRWLGLDWQEGPDIGGDGAPYRQSQRTGLYQDALAQLAERGLTYLCDCSRRDIAAAASAPHAGEEGPRYPGSCRSHGMRERDFRRPPAVRLALPPDEIAIDDLFQGPVRERVADLVGDFVLRRGDGIYAYQLAVVVDDLAMNITEVVRGADLLSSAPRQVLLAQLLGGRAPSFAHVPLILAADGQRLEKRNPRHTLRGLRHAGVDPRRVVAQLAHKLGIVGGDPEMLTPRQLLSCCDLGALRGQREVTT